MDIDIKDISNDDLQDLNLNDTLFKLHMTMKLLSGSVDNLENYMYTGYLQFPDKKTLDDLTQEINMWCNLIKGQANSINKKGTDIIDTMWDNPDDHDGGD